MVQASSNRASSSIAAPLAHINRLESDLFSLPFDPNPLRPLLALARHPSPEIVHKAIWALHRAFIKFLHEEKIGGFTGIGVGRARGGELMEVVESGEERETVRGWLRERLEDYLEVLAGLVRDSEPALRSSAVTLLFSLLAPLSFSISQPGQPSIHTPYFRTILNSLFHPTPSLRGSSGHTKVVEENQVDLEEGVLPADVVQMVHEDYWAKFDDLRWIFFREATHVLRNDSSFLSHPDNLLAQLLPLTNLPKVQEDLNTFFLPSFAEPPKVTSLARGKSNTANAKSGKVKKRKVEQSRDLEKLPDWMATYDSDSSSSDSPILEKGVKRARIRTTQLSIHGSVHSVASHQSQYSSLWEAVLSVIHLDDSWTRRLLVSLHGESGILGHMKSERRVRVADWLGGLVDRGGANALLAMNGLFVLMTQFNLDYPNFYERLYSLLDRNVLHVKYRARFFRLLDTFLASTLLPAALVASFIKRLSRLTLTAPPAGIIMIIPFIYNLLKRHPGCMVMIQRHGDDQDSYTDLYDENDPSPLTTNAIASSLWELAGLRSHYLASVSTMAKVFQEVFTKPEYNMEDFLDHGYGTLFDTEIHRKLKYPPAMALSLEHPDGSVEGVFGMIREAGKAIVENDVVGRLWSF